jgi:2-hydroxy-3-keto-5-methylthiopentenyl-1-phosphate phosphatase
MVKRIVFCDFDGTITTEDTFVAIMRQIVPETCDRLLPELFARRMTLRKGVKLLIEDIPTSRYAEIIELSRPYKIRSGFVELLDFLDSRNIPMVLVSGGLLCMVETVIGNLRDRLLGIHACDLDFTGDFLRVYSGYEHGSELMAKVQVIAEYECDEAIAIGDSVTDLQMALHVPIVFARDRLANYLDAEYHKPYFAWNDFFDVRDRLIQYLSKDVSPIQKSVTTLL